jgi:hypothetical protein
MLTMEARDRQELTSGVLRVVLASQRLMREALDQNSPPTNSWAGSMAADPLDDEPGWDRNHPFQTARLQLRTTTESACQHGLSLFELSRSKRELAVPLATVTRGSIEALGRAFWLINSTSMRELVSRAASLEYYDMEYPSKYGQKLRRLPVETEPTILVSEYRAELKAWLDARGIPLVKKGTTGLATDLLEVSYGNGRVVYSDLSAAAHGQGWATANFYSFETTRLKRDDEMLLAYCMYFIESMRTASVRLARAFGVAAIDIDRWRQVLDQIDAMIGEFVKPAPDRAERRAAAENPDQQQGVVE